MVKERVTAKLNNLSIFSLLINLNSFYIKREGLLGAGYCFKVFNRTGFKSFWTNGVNNFSFCTCVVSPFCSQNGLYLLFYWVNWSLSEKLCSSMFLFVIGNFFESVCKFLILINFFHILVLEKQYLFSLFSNKYHKLIIWGNYTT